MSTDMDTNSGIVGKCVALEVREDGVRKMLAEELMRLAAQVAIVEACQELVYVLHEYTGVQWAVRLSSLLNNYPPDTMSPRAISQTPVLP